MRKQFVHVIGWSAKVTSLLTPLACKRHGSVSTVSAAVFINWGEIIRVMLVWVTTEVECPLHNFDTYSDRNHRVFFHSLV